MSRILGIILVVVIVVVLLVWAGFLIFGQDSEELMDSTQQGVGELVEEPDSAVDEAD